MAASNVRQNRSLWVRASASRSVSSVTGNSAAHGRPFLVNQHRARFRQFLDNSVKPRLHVANILDFHTLNFLPSMNRSFAFLSANERHLYFPAGDAIEHSQIIDPKLEVGQLRRAPQWEPVARTNGRVIFFQARLDCVPELGSVRRRELAELRFRTRRDPDPTLRHETSVVLLRTSK